MSTLNDIIKRFKFIFEIRQVDTEELTNAPIGWKTLLVEYSRSTTYSGLVRNISGQLDFVGKSAYLLRKEYAKYRLMGHIVFRIEKDTRQPYNTYSNIYTGAIDFSKKIDSQTGFTVNAKSNDFSVNVDAYDNVKYSISLDDGINLELPGIALNETATLLPSDPPDGILHSDYFPPINIVNNTQNSIDPSVQNVTYGQLRLPDFSVMPNWFFQCRYDGKLYFTGNIQFEVVSASGSHHLRLSIVDDTGAIVIAIYDAIISTSGIVISYTFNTTLNVTKGQKLFLYVQQVDGPNINTGIFWGNDSQINLSYQTITPPTMCKALRAYDLFGKLLQKMNVNTDSLPNLPVAYQSFLLSGQLYPLVFTSSDSIRAAEGSIFTEGETIGPGVYKVIDISCVYDGVEYFVNQTFGFIDGVTSFTGTGAIQKIQSIYTGIVYNIGDTLQAGGTYLVEGADITYNSHTYHPGEIFKFVFGQDTFTSGDTSAFVKQIATDPQIIMSFSDFFQCIKSVMGGDVAFGATPMPFIETLGAVYIAGSSVTPLGNVPKDWKSEAAIDMIYNTIKTGQEDQQYDAINGSLEVSSTQYYSTSLLNPVAELNLVSPIRFDPYGIETVRITQNDTAASRSDNDVFGVWIEDTPVSTTPFEYWHPLGSSGLSQPIVGVDPSYYNWMLSPKRNLLRGHRYLASIFYGMQGQQITLSGYLKNVGMITVDLAGVRVAESDAIQISDLGSPYFIPEYYTMTIPGDLIDGNEYSEISFNVNGSIYKGFVVSYKTNLATSAPQEIKLLLSPGNDLSKTVR